MFRSVSYNGPLATTTSASRTQRLDHSHGLQEIAESFNRVTPGLKSESKKVLQKAQEYLNQHHHQLEQNNHQCGGVIHHDSVQDRGDTCGTPDEDHLQQYAKEGHQQLTEI